MNFRKYAFGASFSFILGMSFAAFYFADKYEPYYYLSNLGALVTLNGNNNYISSVIFIATMLSIGFMSLMMSFSTKNMITRFMTFLIAISVVLVAIPIDASIYGIDISVLHTVGSIMLMTSLGLFVIYLYNKNTVIIMFILGILLSYIMLIFISQTYIVNTEFNILQAVLQKIIFYTLFILLMFGNES